MNPYKTLGVTDNASADDIKKAYKKLSMDNHPDRGGSSEVMADINKAYEILKDPISREQYDKNGFIESNDRIISAAYGIISSFLGNAIMINLTNKCDVIELSRDNINTSLKEDEIIIKSLQKRIEDIEYYQKLIKTKDGKASIIDEMLKGEIDIVKQNIISTEFDMKVKETAIKLLGEYEYSGKKDTVFIRTQGTL